MYVLVTDYGYEDYATHECDDLAEVIEVLDGTSADFYALYEIKREVSQIELAEERQAVLDEREARVNAVKDKLTDAELQLLGVSR